LSGSYDEKLKDIFLFYDLISLSSSPSSTYITTSSPPEEQTPHRRFDTQYSLSTPTTKNLQWQWTSISASTMLLAPTNPQTTLKPTPPMSLPQSYIKASFKVYPTTSNAIKPFSVSFAATRPAKTPC
jgi:hypothetical protein